MSNKAHISICGIGPGNPDYISRIVYQEVEKADVLIGGQRQLSIFEDSGKEFYVFDGKTANLKVNIQNYINKFIVVLVSGDTGFHSLRRYIVDTFPHADIKVFPGISTFQYFYAQLGLGYEKAFLSSLHGTETDYVTLIKKHTSVFLLTDRKNNYKTIAKNLSEKGLGYLQFHIGSNLSYDDEQILSMPVEEAKNLKLDFSLCAVIIENKEVK